MRRLVLIATSVLLSTLSPLVKASEAEPDIILSEARDAIADSEYERAVAIVEELLGRQGLTDSEIVDALKVKGSALMRDEKYESALANFEAALQLAPNDVWLLWQRCWTSTRFGFLLTAARDCRRARAVMESKRGNQSGEPIDDVYITLAEAELARAQGRPAASLEILSKYRSPPNSEPVGNFDSTAEAEGLGWYFDQQIGLSLFALGQFEDGVAAFGRALDSTDTSLIRERAHLYYSRGSAQFTIGNTQDALEDFRSAAELLPENTDFAYSHCAAILLVESWPDDGTHACGKLTALDPSRADYQDAHGLALMRADEIEGALERFGKALTLEPSNQVFRSHFDEALGKSRKPVELDSVIDPAIRELIGIEVD